MSVESARMKQASANDANVDMRGCQATVTAALEVGSRMEKPA